MNYLKTAQDFQFCMFCISRLEIPNRKMERTETKTKEEIDASKSIMNSQLKEKVADSIIDVSFKL